MLGNGHAKEFMRAVFTIFRAAFTIIAITA